MRSILCALSAAISLASCAPAPKEAETNVAGPAVAPPEGNAAGRSLAEFRATALEGCIGGARDAAPPGTPVERHCECAIDREMAGRSLDELEESRRTGDYGPAFQAHMRACMAEISPEMVRRR